MTTSLKAAAAAVAALALTLVPSSPALARVDEGPPAIEFTYDVQTRGDVQSDVQRFAEKARATLADIRGWSLGGSIAYRRVDSGGDFTLWLASPEAVENWAPGCSSQWSCTVGDDVIINDARWREGSPYWEGPLEEYRHYVITHELGHWHDLGHRSCPGNGTEAPVMMQQSKGEEPCFENVWPLPSERTAVANRYGVEVRRHSPLGYVWPHADLEPHPEADGHWVVERGGEIEAFGAAAYHGDAETIGLHAPIVGMAATPTGDGYWLAAADGGVFTFGDASFHGSAAGYGLHEPVVDITATETGDGYWLTAGDGGVFTFGDAAFHGSAAPYGPHRPVMGIARSSGGDGYWLVAADGGVFSFGDAVFHGSAAPIDQRGDVIDIARNRAGDGYWLSATDGGVFTFGDAGFHGSAATEMTGIEYAAIGAYPAGGGYWLLDADERIKAYGAAG